MEKRPGRTGITPDSDERLLERACNGDRSAFGALYLRHRRAARFVAGQWSGCPADADDAVAEGFARVFAALPRMAPGQIVFRSYVLAAVRNAAKERFRRQRRIDLREAVPEAPADDRAEDRAVSGLERELLAEALQGLPERWARVLWLTEIDGLSPAEVARRYDMKPNAVSALAYRARCRLRQTYLQAHLRSEPDERCRDVVSRLSGYVRRTLGGAERVALDRHLNGCAGCRRRLVELADLNAALRQALLPVTSLMPRAAELMTAAAPLPLSSARLVPRMAAGVAVGLLALTGPVHAPNSPPSPPAEVAPVETSAAATPPSGDDAAVDVKGATGGQVDLDGLLPVPPPSLALPRVDVAVDVPGAVSVDVAAALPAAVGADVAAAVPAALGLDIAAAIPAALRSHAPVPLGLDVAVRAAGPALAELTRMPGDVAARATVSVPRGRARLGRLPARAASVRAIADRRSGTVRAPGLRGQRSGIFRAPGGVRGWRH